MMSLILETSIYDTGHNKQQDTPIRPPLWQMEAPRRMLEGRGREEGELRS